MNGNIYQVWKFRTMSGFDYRIGNKGIFDGYRKGYTLIPHNVRHGSELAGYIEAESREGALKDLQFALEGNIDANLVH